MPVNLVIYQGNLGQPPREITTRRKERAAILNVACNESYTDSNGERQEAATWVGIACYGKVADYVLDVLDPVPGDELLIEGKLNSYQTDDRGARRTVVQVLAKVVKRTKSSTTRAESHYTDFQKDDEIPF